MNEEMPRRAEYQISSQKYGIGAAFAIWISTILMAMTLMIGILLG